MSFQNTLAFAQQSDASDPLRSFRSKFYFPEHNGKEVVYFTGNSLGLQPKTTQAYIQQELNDWAKFGVEGHFLAKNPWMPYHEFLTEKMARIVGALPEETVMMNQLTVNIHLLMVSFYRPTKQRYKILCEAKAFPSDQYALQTQIQFHGLKVEDALIEIAPREGEYHIREEDIYSAIEKNKDSLALIMIGGVNYFNGRFSRDVTNEYMYVGKFKLESGFAFIYKSFMAIADTLNPVKTFVVTYDTTGKMIENEMIGCFCSPTESRSFIINKDLSINITNHITKWEFDPLEKGYAGNNIISREESSKEIISIDKNGTLKRDAIANSSELKPKNGG